MPDLAELFLCIMLSVCGSATILNAILISLVKGPIIRWKLVLRAIPWIAFVGSGVLFVYGSLAFGSWRYFIYALIIYLFTIVFMALSQAMGEKMRDGESPTS